MEPGSQASLFRNIVYPLSYGPMAYLYTRSLTEENPKLFPRDLFHFAPFLLFAIILSLIPDELHPHRPPNPRPPLNGGQPFLLPGLLMDAVIFISVSTYSLYILRILKRHTESIENYFSTITDTRALTWLKWTIWLFVILFIWNSFSPVLFKFAFHSLEIRFIRPHEFRFIHSGVFILFSYILSFFTIRQSTVYPQKEIEPIIKPENPETSKEEKYTRSGLKEEEAKAIANKLLEYMDKEKPYLREDLRIRDVADDIGVNLNYLSQALNEVIQKNFYQFVNEYRVKEVQNRLKNPAFKEHSLLRIALECGFNSKSSFNATFRRFTEISPKEFRKTILSG
jgi:AraC-like DNA-binding protein